MGSSLALARLLAIMACVGSACLDPATEVLVASPAPAAARPKLQILDPEPHTTVNEGEVLTHVFHIRNVGDAPLVITNIRPSGGVEWTGPDGVTVTICGQFVGWDGQPR